MTLQIGGTPVETTPKTTEEPTAPETTEQVVEDPKPGDPGYDEAMREKFRSRSIEGEADEVETVVPPKPDIGADKFYDPKTGTYNWEAHAREQAFNANRAKAPEKPGDKPGESEADPDTTAGDVIAAAGLKVEDLRSTITTSGALAEDQVAALEKAGLPRDLIDEYVDLAKYRLEAESRAAVEYAGGEEETNRLLAWAEANFDQATKARVNGLLAGPDWRDGIDLIRARAPMGEGQRISNTVSGQTTSQGFRSRAEMLRAMREVDETTGRRKYETDPAYRRQVEQRIAVSRFEADRPTETPYHVANPVGSR